VEGVEIRSAASEDFAGWFSLFSEVAAEGKWVGSEAPLDQEARRERFQRSLDSADQETFLAHHGGRLIGVLGMELSRGLAELGMLVDAAWRRRGVGSQLMETGIAWARERGAHKVVLEVWPHNTAAQALYRKFGFAEEAVLRRHYRRNNGQLWDAIGMGLVLDHDSPGSPFTPSSDG